MRLTAAVQNAGARCRPWADSYTRRQITKSKWTKWDEWDANFRAWMYKALLERAPHLFRMLEARNCILAGREKSLQEDLYLITEYERSFIFIPSDEFLLTSSLEEVFWACYWVKPFLLFKQIFFPGSLSHLYVFLISSRLRLMALLRWAEATEEWNMRKGFVVTLPSTFSPLDTECKVKKMKGRSLRGLTRCVFSKTIWCRVYFHYLLKCGVTRSPRNCDLPSASDPSSLPSQMSPGLFSMLWLIRDATRSPCLVLEITATVERSRDVFKIRPRPLADCSAEALSYIYWVSNEASASSANENALTSWHFITKVKSLSEDSP